MRELGRKGGKASAKRLAADLGELRRIADPGDRTDELIVPSQGTFPNAGPRQVPSRP
jgi:hypothetical protein